MGTAEDKGEWVKYGLTKEKWDRLHDEAARASAKANRLIDNLPENYNKYMAEVTEPWPEQKPKLRKVSTKHD